ncbi:hypothetical protein PR048_024696 [Dryococelus australis]|uniref:Uncharacterized protein n=1 Tax=Dryococelus australis TaxID=614101 RepID=A0ABQ9GPA6_9NEOP|nr:hypothetical protein PR048_024696 [Dryococelus australis]
MRRAERQTKMAILVGWVDSWAALLHSEPGSTPAEGSLRIATHGKLTDIAVASGFSRVIPVIPVFVSMSRLHRLGLTCTFGTQFLKPFTSSYSSSYSTRSPNQTDEEEEVNPPMSTAHIMRTMSIMRTIHIMLTMSIIMSTPQIVRTMRIMRGAHHEHGAHHAHGHVTPTRERRQHSGYRLFTVTVHVVNNDLLIGSTSPIAPEEGRLWLTKLGTNFAKDERLQFWKYCIIQVLTRNATFRELQSVPVFRQRHAGSENTDPACRYLKTETDCSCRNVAFRQSHTPGSSAPTYERSTTVCPNHVQLTQKGSDLTGTRWCRPQTTRLPPRLTKINSRGVAPEFSHVGIVPDAAAGRRVFSGISRFPRPLHSGAAPYALRFTLLSIPRRQEPPKSHNSVGWTPACKVKKLGSDTGDTNTHAWRLIAPTSKVCSVSAVLGGCEGGRGWRMEVFSIARLSSHSHSPFQPIMKKAASSIRRWESEPDHLELSEEERDSDVRSPLTPAEAMRRNPLDVLLGDCVTSAQHRSTTERLSPVQANRLPPLFSHVGIACRTMPLAGEVFSGISRFSRPCIPALFRTHLASTLIGSQDLDVKSRPNLFTFHSLGYHPNNLKNMIENNAGKSNMAADGTGAPVPLPQSRYNPTTGIEFKLWYDLPERERERATRSVSLIEPLFQTDKQTPAYTREFGRISLAAASENSLFALTDTASYPPCKPQSTCLRTRNSAIEKWMFKAIVCAE